MVLPSNLGITIGGYAAAALLLWLWLGARDDVATAGEQCNTEKMAAVAEAEKLTREATNAALERRIAEFEQLVRRQANARSVAIAARLEAEEAAAEAQAEIRRLQGAINAESEIQERCLVVTVPQSVADSLR